MENPTTTPFDRYLGRALDFSERWAPVAMANPTLLPEITELLASDLCRHFVSIGLSPAEALFCSLTADRDPAEYAAVCPQR